jgi:hypothetical protein
MAVTLADPYLKTARAHEHLEDLRDRLRRFTESEPCRIFREDDIKNRVHIIRIELKDPPHKVALVVGDFLYCLRSSLDQLVWALSLHNTGRYPQGTQFPIFSAPKPNKFMDYTVGVAADAIREIELLQPYQGGHATLKSNCLWQLNLLCNIDKHRRIPIGATITDFRFPNVPQNVIRLIRFDNDAGVIRVPLAFKGYMTLNPEVPLNVLFGDSHEGVRVDLARLEAIYEFVALTVIPRFARFLK